MSRRWSTTAEALVRLAEDQAGKPEGDAAEGRLLAVLKRHPEARNAPGVVSFLERKLGVSQRPAPPTGPMTLREWMDIRRGVNVYGRWTGTNLNDALHRMERDLRARQEQAERVRVSFEDLVESMGPVEDAFRRFGEQVQKNLEKDMLERFASYERWAEGSK
jgi:hypothetical protein